MALGGLAGVGLLVDRHEGGSENRPGDWFAADSAVGGSAAGRAFGSPDGLRSAGAAPAAGRHRTAWRGTACRSAASPRGSSRSRPAVRRRTPTARPRAAGIAPQPTAWDGQARSCRSAGSLGPIAVQCRMISRPMACAFVRSPCGPWPRGGRVNRTEDPWRRRDLRSWQAGHEPRPRRPRRQPLAARLENASRTRQPRLLSWRDQRRIGFAGRGQLRHQESTSVAEASRSASQATASSDTARLPVSASCATPFVGKILPRTMF